MCNRVFGDIQRRSPPRQTAGMIGAAKRGTQLGVPRDHKLASRLLGRKLCPAVHQLTARLEQV